MSIDLCVNKIVKYAHSGELNFWILWILGIKTDELDNLIAETAAYLNMLHPDCGRLAARVAVTALHKRTKDTFSDVIE
jgi:hypothetical protein